MNLVIEIEEWLEEIMLSTPMAEESTLHFEQPMVTIEVDTRAEINGM